MRRQEDDIDIKSFSMMNDSMETLTIGYNVINANPCFGVRLVLMSNNQEAQQSGKKAQSVYLTFIVSTHREQFMQDENDSSYNGLYSGRGSHTIDNDIN